MRKTFLFCGMALASLMAVPVNALENSPSPLVQVEDGSGIFVTLPRMSGEAELRTASNISGTLFINGTGASETFQVSCEGLTDDVELIAPAGFSVSPSVVSKDAKDVDVTVTFNSWKNEGYGILYLKSGMVRRKVVLRAYGTPLEKKALSLDNNLFVGDDAFEVTKRDGFEIDADKGYTVEVKVKASDEKTVFNPYFITEDGYGFKGGISGKGMSKYNSTSELSISNPATHGGDFYNNDGEFHVYRYAVTPDKRVFIYRDGLAVDTVRMADLGNQPDWTDETGDYVENLVKNPGFEGEWNWSASRNIVTDIEGWNVSPFDQYNSTQEIIDSCEIDMNQDESNHALSVDRYMWSDGWAAAEISQIVDVAPNETYSFSALAKGGLKSDGTILGSLRISEVQNPDKNKKISVTSEDFETYATDYTTSADCRQLRIACYLERDKWGASITPIVVDNVKLTGKSRLYKQMIGYENSGAEVEYMTFDLTGAYAPEFAVINTSVDSLSINGTGANQTFTVSASALQSDKPIMITAPAGFSVSPAELPYNAENAEVTVTNTSTKKGTYGKLVLRSGSVRAYVALSGEGTPLEQKEISGDNIYDPASGTFEISEADGFKPDMSKGYTVEFKAKVADADMVFSPYFLTSDGTGFKGYVSGEGMGKYNSSSELSISNPATHGGSFYNDDDEYHVYRYAVTPDKRVFIYRDGLAVDTVRMADLGAQADWTVETGDYAENLVKNPGFEGEWNWSASRNIVTDIEGWNVSPFDQYNSTQNIANCEIDNVQDYDNHALEVRRYMWSDGWAAGEISQIVDVAPNETYSFSALAKGGIKSDGTILGSLRIREVQDSEKGKNISVTSDEFETYATDYTTSADCKQLRISCYLERDKWGASISALTVDNVKLTGKSRVYKQMIGYENDGAEIEYMKYDLSGAYAPLASSIAVSSDSLSIKGTGASQTFTVSASALQSDKPIKITAPAGFSVSPAELPYNAENAEVTVTNTSTKKGTYGKLVLRSGSVRAYVALSGEGTPLEQKEISGDNIYDPASGTFEISEADGFKPDMSKGYTVEFKAKVADADMVFSPYFLTSDGTGFKGYVSGEGMGKYNSSSELSISNPATHGGSFYNDDDEYHVYRYAVTPDKRVFIYRDGLAVDTVRMADLGAQADWTVETGDYAENLVKNPGFEGEWNWSASRNIVTDIEGWNVSPFDQYNSTQNIANCEIDNVQDYDNHALEVRRYMWSDGWAAGEISQIVDVAPNETYSFSALAKGGIKSDGTILGSLRIREVQDSEKGKNISVTSDEFETYATDYTTSADCKQLRIVCYLERDKWGASISALTVDNVKLTGKSRVYKQMIGYENDGAEIEYMKYDLSGAYAPLASSIAVSSDSLSIKGTGASQTFTVSASALQSDKPIKITAPAGFSVSPAELPYNAENAEVTVTNTSTKKGTYGKLVLRSGSARAYVHLWGEGTPLERKDISSNQNIAVEGSDGAEVAEADGFVPDMSKGYTVEFRAKTSDLKGGVYPYFLTNDGLGFKGYVSGEGMGKYNSTSELSISNPYMVSGSFYNDDEEYHTYRYAVTSDKRVFIYRDGLAIDTVRMADLGGQADWTDETGDYVENLVKNPGFEGEWDWSASRNIVTDIEGWNVSPFDQYNSTQTIANCEIDNVQDYDNHALEVRRYMWNDGWAAGEISQVVDVAPNETYSFSALAKGGIKSDGTILGSLRIREVQDSEKGKNISVTSDEFETYATDYTTSADCKQLRIVCYLERDKWGASISALTVDNVKLMGKSRSYKQMVGYTNVGSDIEYFTYDLTGAYAPSVSEISDNTAIGDIESSDNGVKVYVDNGYVYVTGVSDDAVAVLYDLSGKMLERRELSNGNGLALPYKGVFIVKVNEYGKSNSYKVMY